MILPQERINVIISLVESMHVLQTPTFSLRE